MKDIGEMHHFWGVAIQRRSGLFLLQWQYVLNTLRQASIGNCKPSSTPVDTHAKVSVADGAPISDPTRYRSLVDALRSLTFTQLDISYAVQQVCLHMHDPLEPHLSAVKCILRYLQGNIWSRFPTSPNLTIEASGISWCWWGQLP